MPYETLYLKLIMPVTFFSYQTSVVYTQTPECKELFTSSPFDISDIKSALRHALQKANLNTNMDEIKLIRKDNKLFAEGIATSESEDVLDWFVLQGNPYNKLAV